MNNVMSGHQVKRGQILVMLGWLPFEERLSTSKQVQRLLDSISPVLPEISEDFSWPSICKDRPP